MPDIKTTKPAAPAKAKPKRKYYKPKAKIVAEVAEVKAVAPEVVAVPVIKAEEVLQRTAPIAVIPVEQPKKGLWTRFVDRLLARDE